VTVQVCIARSVLSVIVVLAAVSFDDEPRAEVYEIDDIRADRLLAAKFLAAQSMSA